MVTEKSRRSMSILRHKRLRKRVRGTAECPRLAVFRSNKQLYVQVIDDESMTTIAAANTLQKDVRTEVEGKSQTEVAAIVGRVIGQQAIEKGIDKVVFDRGGNKYHGRVKALAEAAREAGLKF
jgi:large subunit ribosomal protein L18